MTGASGSQVVFAGRYRIVRELARGGMGAVYQAHDLRLGRSVAIKVLIQVAAGASADQRARFLREARATAALEHPHIVRVHDVGEVTGRAYIVMDFLTGGSLQGRLKRAGPLDPEEAAVHVRRLADAVQHAHDRGVLHRDIKPHNVLLDADEGGARLADFGLAKVADLKSAAAAPGGPDATATLALDARLPEQGARSLTLSGDVLGTPSYMAPEQADGRADTRSDVYGLGATLYALLTGEPPVSGPTLVNVLTRLMKGQVTRPRELRPELDPELERICMKALACAPEDRYPAAAALAADLDALLTGPPAPARVRARGRRRGAASARRGAASARRGAASARPGAASARRRAKRGPPLGPIVAAVALPLVAGAVLLGSSSSTPAGPSPSPAGPSPSPTGPSPAPTGPLAGAEPSSVTASPRSTPARGETPAEPSAAEPPEVESADAASPDAAPATADAEAPTPAGDDSPAEAAPDARAEQPDPDASPPPAEEAPRIELGERGPSVATLRARAEALEDGGRCAEAVVVLGELLEGRPDDPRALAQRGACRLALEANPEAREDLERAVSLDPGSAHAWTNLGIARLRLEDAAGAVLACSRALELDPDRSLAAFNRGLAHARLRNHDSAEADLRRVLELQPSTSLRARTEEILARVADVRAAEAGDPAGEAARWRGRGVAHAAAGRWQDALAAFDRALELDPDDDVALAYRGQVLVAGLGQLERAIPDLERAVALGTEQAGAWINLGVVRLEQGRTHEGVELLTHALEELKPGDPPALVERGKGYVELGRPEAAAADFRAAIRADPDGPAGRQARRWLERIR